MKMQIKEVNKKQQKFFFVLFLFIMLDVCGEHPSIFLSLKIKKYVGFFVVEFWLQKRIIYERKLPSDLIKTLSH